MVRYLGIAFSLVLAFASNGYAQGGVITQKGATSHFQLLLLIGPEEKMYSEAEAAKMHPSSGEVMVSGTMGSMPMSGMAMDMRHLEVHVTDRVTAKVVTNTTCRITITNNTTKKSEAVPVAAMYGVKEGPSDWHFGNNVSMPPGSYTVTVVVNGEQAIFHLTIP